MNQQNQITLSEKNNLIHLSFKKIKQTISKKLSKQEQELNTKQANKQRQVFHNHKNQSDGKSNPIPKPTAVATAPIKSISPAAFTLLKPKSCDFIRPKLSSSIIVNAITKGQSATFISTISFRMQGNAVTKPNKANEMRVAKPHFAGKRVSLTFTSLSSQRSIMFTKAPQCVAKRSARRMQSSAEYPFRPQISTIQAFSWFKKFLTSYNSLSYSLSTQEISALADTQSHAAISMAPATIVAMVMTNSE